MIDRCDIRAFVSVTEDAGVGQVAYARGAAVFSADDVIDLVRKAGAILFDQAVLATSTRTLDHKNAHGLVYVTSH